MNVPCTEPTALHQIRTKSGGKKKFEQKQKKIEEKKAAK